MAIPKEPHGAVIKRMPAEDDRNFLTGEFEKVLTEKTRFVAITQMSDRPARSFCSR
ncbi:selenocysteine lyase/cysteine desulfurase [Bradyrhizobium sp. GM24.11]